MYQSSATEVTSTCLVDVLRERAIEHPEREFFACEGHRLSYGDLWSDSGAVAASFVEQGLQPSQIVATVAPNSVEHVKVMFGALRAGLVWAPLNIGLGRDDLSATLENLRPDLLLVSSSWISGHVDHLETLSDFGALVLRDGDSSDSPANLSQFASLPSAEAPAYRWHWDEVSWIIYSGATTGRPKGVVQSHSFGVASALRSIQVLGLSERDVFYSVLQMCHGWLDFHVILATLLAGGRCATTQWFSASRWLDQVKAAGATIVDPFLPMISAILAQDRRPEESDHQVRMCVGALGERSEATTDKLEEFEQRFSIPTMNLYGTTETGGLVTSESTEDIMAPSRVRSNGNVFPSYELRIADGDGWPLQDGEVGEILIRPRWPGVLARGYHRDEDRTLLAWRELWVHTGDLGRIESGRLYFTGRQVHWIRRKGENVSAGEVEEAIMRAAPGIDVVVVGIPSPLGDEEIVAFYRSRGTEDINPETIHARLEGSLGFFKIPRYWEEVDEFPTTVKGDVSRLTLRDRGVTERSWDAEQTG